MPRKDDVFLPQIQGRLGGNLQLKFHQVPAGHHLGHGMLHLQSGVAFEEKIVLAGHQKFDGAQVPEPGMGSQPAGIGPKAVRKFYGQVWRRGFLDDLLEAALQRTLPFEHVHHPAFAITGDLHLDMARLFKKPLDHQIGPPKGVFGFAHGRGHRFREALQIADHAHSTPAAPKNSLEQHRQFHAADRVLQLGGVHETVPIAGQHGQAGRCGLTLGGYFIAKACQGIRARTNEGQTGPLDCFGEPGMFRQKSDARVNRVCLGVAGGLQDGIDVEVAVIVIGANNLNGFSDRQNMKGVAVGRGVHRRGGDPQPLAGSRNTAGDFPPRGDQNF